MKECRKIESLIYLYRDNELSREEEKTVRDHAGKCQECRDILTQLRSIDAAISPIRSEMPELPGNMSLASETMKLIAGKNRTAAAGGSAFGIDRLLEWLRPALAFAVVAAALMLAYQESRDARKIAELEIYQRNVAEDIGPYGAPDAGRLIGLASKGNFSESAAGIEPIRLIGSELAGLFRSENLFFDHFSSRYPKLSEVNVEDGIDPAEEIILATEGKALLRELERILKQGENLK